MKINSILCFFLLSFLVSCGSDEEPMTPEEMTEESSFSVKVNGVSLSIANIQVIKNNPILLIAGSTAGAAKIVQVPLNMDVSPGTYPADGLYTSQYIEGSNIWNANNGTFTITKNDITAKRIEGTFEFDASPISGTASDVSVTEGSFKVNY